MNPKLEAVSSPSAKSAAIVRVGLGFGSGSELSGRSAKPVAKRVWLRVPDVLRQAASWT